MKRPYKILIADDDPGITDALFTMLDFEGYDVEITHNGSDVLQLEEPLPDLLLLDIWMSGEDGRELCQALKSREETRRLPVLMISASNDVAQSARNSGADDFIAKPFEMEELLQKVAELIGRETG